jgi:hypothetical protein
MDPNECMASLLRLANAIADRAIAPGCGDAERLAELVLAIDGWVCKGGFLPKRWEDACRMLASQPTAEVHGAHDAG